MPQLHENDESPGVVPPEAAVRELVAQISEFGGARGPRSHRATPGTEWLMQRAMGNPGLRTQMFGRES
ncbi:MAG: hypothetical protein ABSF89_02195 [Acidimicrobiales bacterium]